MSLVLVGDVAAAPARTLVQQVFGAIARPLAPVPERPQLGAPDRRERELAIVQPDASEVHCRVECARVLPLAPLTQAAMREGVSLQAACEMARWALVYWTKDRESPVLRVDVTSMRRSRWLGACLVGPELEFTCPPQQAAEALWFCSSMIHALCARGFTAEHLDPVRTRELERLEAAVTAEAQNDSSARATAVAAALAHGDVPITAAQRRDLLRPAWLELQAEQCSAAFAAAWRAPSITAIGPTALDFALRPVWSAALKLGPATPVVAQEAFELRWPYDSAAVPAGDLPVPEHHAALDVDEVRLPNGVRALSKRTSFSGDEVRIAVLSGRGGRDVSDAALPKVVAYGAAFRHLGLGKLSPGQLRALASARAPVHWEVTESAFELSSVTNRAALCFALERLYAHCSDPGWDEEGLAHVTKYVTGLDGTARHSFEMTRSQFWHGLAGRRCVPTEDEVLEVTMAQLQAWWSNILARAPMTVVVIGDLDVAATVAALARTFGRLPARDRPSLPAWGHPLRGGVHEERTIVTADARSEVSFGVALPADADPWLDLSLMLLPSIIQDRLRVRVREQLGEVYAPLAELRWVAGGHAFLAGLLQVATGHEQRIRELCLQELASLRERGVSDDELERARAPMLRRVEIDRQSNARWVVDLARAHSRPQALAECADQLARMRALTAADLSRSAAQYLRAEAVSTLIVRPQASK